MALLYTALGVAAGLLGEGLAALAAEARGCWRRSRVLLVVLSLSMFGLYELQLPAALRDGLSSKGDRMRGGQLAGVFAMGGMSALVVEPVRRRRRWPRRAAVHQPDRRRRAGRRRRCSRSRWA